MKKLIFFDVAIARLYRSAYQRIKQLPEVLDVDIWPLHFLSDDFLEEVDEDGDDDREPEIREEYKGVQTIVTVGLSFHGEEVDDYLDKHHLQLIELVQRQEDLFIDPLIKYNLNISSGIKLPIEERRANAEKKQRHYRTCRKSHVIVVPDLEKVDQVIAILP